MTVDLLLGGLLPWRAIEGPLDSHVYGLATGQGRLFAGLGHGARDSVAAVEAALPETRRTVA